jgi:hypothetical protein
MHGFMGAVISANGGLSLTFEKPRVRVTTFYAGTEGGTGFGATNETALLADIWAGFQTRRITRAADPIDPNDTSTPLTFWENWSGPAPAETAAQLILTGDGKCGAWADFFIDVLRAWGGNFSHASNFRQIEVDHQDTPVQASVFLVGDWAFGNPNLQFPRQGPFAGYLWYNEVGNPGLTHIAPPGSAPGAPAVWRYNWEGQPAVNYVEGSAQNNYKGSAQNNDNPFASFFNHVVVRIGNILYDPSYGVTYQSTAANPTDDNLLQAFQTDAITGYAWESPVLGEIDTPTFYYRPAVVANAPTVKLMFVPPST